MLIVQTASLWTLFNSTLADEETFPSVKYASFGGELTPPHVLREARKRFPKAFVTVGFSSTESVQGGFGTAYGPDFDLENLTEIVVRPNQNITELLLLDNADKPVEMKNGATGRVAIVTAASADPYLIAPEGKRTAQDEKDMAAIVDTYRTTKDGKRMIVYGDRAIYRPDADGTPGIVVLGREGRRIKRNGVFIDLGAVDSLLLKALPETLGDASTMAAGKVLVCLITAKPGSKGTLPDLEELNEVLARDTDVLLGMAVPIERTPIAVSGKKDWTALQGLADEAAAGEFAALPTLAKEDALARTISQHVADVLGEARLVNRDAPMTRVGMDSIGAARLLNILRKLEGGHRLRSDDVLTEDASVSRLATRMRGEGKVEEVMGQAYLDAEVERLAPQLKTLSGSSEKTTVKNVVLTGATGYLGSFILAELLLAYPDATVWCITRTGGLQRLLVALARTRVDIPAERIQAHVRAMQGDLGLPRLGLKKEDVARVKEADLILHNGALVHWTRPYKALLGPNVHSLLALLSMAAPHARLTFVSGGGQTALDEGNANAFADANGYTATKYVAEQLCARAGPNVKVLRPGYIIGEPVCNADDFLWRLLRVVVELGMYVQRKEGAAPMNAAPVRYVARLVIEPRAAVDRIWVQCTTDQFWDALIKEGYELKAVSDEEWERRLEEDLAQRGSEHPLVALAPFAHGLSNGLGYPRPEDLPREVIEESVMRGCVRYLRETGAIPNPDGSWVNVEEGRIGRTGR
jgi:thioester reductase-like protein